MFNKVFSTPSSTPSPAALLRDMPLRNVDTVFDHQGHMLRLYENEAQNDPDVALQLPTGSGKTLVGLLIAEWRRRKFGERVVYLCPTNQLVKQVADQAITKYGMSVEAFATKKANFTAAAQTAYEDASRIAITSYSHLFNVNPFFKNADVIILDDAHAAENYIASAWSLQLKKYDSNEASAFAAIMDVIKNVIPPSSLFRLSNDSENRGWVEKIPSPAVATIADELTAVIHANVAELRQVFPWTMLQGNLNACQIYLSQTEILIRPVIPPTWDHEPFSKPKQRIYMSATLGEGGDLERLTGRRNIKRLPIPEEYNAQGIGRRFFIFPGRSLEDSEARELRNLLLRTARRGVILTTSKDESSSTAEQIRADINFTIYDAEDLEDGKADFAATDGAVAVIANRYDGIDFPGDDCRLLFVDGLPKAINLQERFLMSRMGANVLFNERVQTRVLQAVGRCTRGLKDYSAVVITGDDLPSYLNDKQRRSSLHPELQAELEFGLQYSTDTNAATLLGYFDVFLARDKNWESADKQIVDLRARAQQLKFEALEDLASSVKHEIDWQAAMWAQDYAAAFEAARNVLSELKNPALKGYRAAWHYLAGTAASLATTSKQAEMSALAIDQFKHAKGAASNIPWLVNISKYIPTPTGTVSGDPEDITAALQIEQLENYLSKFGSINNVKFARAEKLIRDNLSHGETFELGHRLLGDHIGFVTGKIEADASPDPWWNVNDLTIVFEDHADAKETGAVISATKAKQSALHEEWLRHYVPSVAKGEIVTALISPALKAKSGAIPSLQYSCYWNLDSFREWSETVLSAVRELRQTFREPGDVLWRTHAVTTLNQINATAPRLAKWLKSQRADKVLNSDQ